MNISDRLRDLAQDLSQYYHEAINPRPADFAGWAKNMEDLAIEQDMLDGIIEYESFDDVPQTFHRKWLSDEELEEAKKKLHDVLVNDLRLHKSLVNVAVEHMVSLKAMFNAGYSRDYIKKLTIVNGLVKELRDTKIKLKERNKQYARASNTIFELRGKLALTWREKMPDYILATLQRVEKIQQQLMEKK